KRRGWHLALARAGLGHPEGPEMAPDGRHDPVRAGHRRAAGHARQGRHPRGQDVQRADMADRPDSSDLTVAAAIERLLRRLTPPLSGKLAGTAGSADFGVFATVQLHEVGVVAAVWLCGVGVLA